MRKLFSKIREMKNLGVSQTQVCLRSSNNSAVESLMLMQFHVHVKTQIGP